MIFFFLVYVKLNVFLQYQRGEQLNAVDAITELSCYFCRNNLSQHPYL